MQKVYAPGLCDQLGNPYLTAWNGGTVTGAVTFKESTTHTKGLINTSGTYDTPTGTAVKIGDCSTTPGQARVFLEFSNRPDAGCVLIANQVNAQGVQTSERLHTGALEVISGMFAVQAGVPSTLAGPVSVSGSTFTTADGTVSTFGGSVRCNKGLTVGYGGLLIEDGASFSCHGSMTVTGSARLHGSTQILGPLECADTVEINRDIQAYSSLLLKGATSVISDGYPTRSAFINLRAADPEVPTTRRMLFSNEVGFKFQLGDARILTLNGKALGVGGTKLALDNTVFSILPGEAQFRVPLKLANQTAAWPNKAPNEAVSFSDVRQINPVGQIICGLFTSAPDYTLPVEGGTYRQADYPVLLPVIRNNPAVTVSGSTTFTLPDWRPSYRPGERAFIRYQ